jgi:hypothetical protein
MPQSALAFIALLLLAGCGTEYQSAAPPPAAATTANSLRQIKSDEKAPETLAKAALDRQIIYRAQLTLHVEDFAAADKQITALIKDSGGYIAQFREDRPHGGYRGGHWTARIPVNQFDQFLSALTALGVTERREVQADDITEEFVDLTARLKNKQQLETRLLDLVAKRGDEIKDVLALEAELNRVREEIERMQGRLRYLSDRVALTTVEISAYERRGYRPPESTLAGRVSHAFTTSLDALRRLGEFALLFAVALSPWMLVLTALALPIFLMLRIRRR